MNTWAVIYNPTAGGVRLSRLEAIERTLHGQGIAARLLPTRHPGHAEELARGLEGVARVAVYGGDGTLNEAANGLLGSNLPLAFFPGGTANVMAHELGLPNNPLRAAQALIRGTPRQMRPGMLGTRAFLLMAGFGFDGEAVRSVHPPLKRISGKGAYLWSGLQAARGSLPELRVTAPGGEVLHGHWAVVARSARYGGRFRIHPAAGLLEGGLGLTVVNRRWILPFLGLHMGLDLHRDRGGVFLRRAGGFRIESEVPLPVQVDGDYFGSGRMFETGISGDSLLLCYP